MALHAVLEASSGTLCREGWQKWEGMPGLQLPWVALENKGA